MAAGRGCHGLESVEDRASADDSGVVQASKPDLMAKGVAIDLLQYEADEYEDLSGKENLPLVCVVEDD